jgi:hypothetical protein
MLGGGRKEKSGHAVAKPRCVLVEGIRDKQTVGINGSTTHLSAYSPIVGI